MELLTDLPGTRTPKALAARATALAAWRARLARGVLPEVGALATPATKTANTGKKDVGSKSFPWPDPELAAALVSALRDLEMPRFCSKHPALLDTLLKQLVGLVNDYEKALAEAGLLDEEGNRIREEEDEVIEEEEDRGEEGFDEDFGKEEQSSSDEAISSSSSSGRGGSGGGGGGQGGDDEGEEDDDCDPEDLDDDDDGGGESGDNQNGSSSRGQRSSKSSSGSKSDDLDLQASLEQAMSGDELAEMLRRQQQKLNEQSKKLPSSDEIASKLSKELAEKFSRDWRDAAQSLRAAEAALDPEAVESLVAGDPAGFDSTAGLWQDAGWKEVASLSKVLSDCRELRDLVRSLGRSAGRGPRRRAPAQVAAPKGSPGVLRSPLQPEETAGLARSGDISRMLPSEAHLVAVGWPKGRGVATRSVEVSASIDTDDDEEDEEGGESGSGIRSKSESGSKSKSRNLTTTTVSVLVEGSRPARLLHMARRAERTLMSYERDGWLDDPGTRPTGRFEVRPAAEDGPLILCLDTSGSMAGAREQVAKAVALEAARSARRARRRCLLYAFSGPGDLKQLELDPSTTTGASDLLSFLRCSFGGGTDADAPLEAALLRLEESEWAAADVLMVTDGEIPPPNPEVSSRLARAKEELGLQVHGLLVGGRGSNNSNSANDEPISEGMAAICSRVHVFKSWSAVGGR